MKYEITEKDLRRMLLFAFRCGKEDMWEKTMIESIDEYFVELNKKGKRK